MVLWGVREQTTRRWRLEIGFISLYRRTAVVRNGERSEIGYFVLVLKEKYNEDVAWYACMCDVW